MKWILLITVLSLSCTEDRVYFTDDLIKAIELSDINQAQKVINAGVVINAQVKSWGPIHTAAFRNNLELMKLLLSNGADVNLKGWDDWAPIHIACENDNFEMVKLLLNYGANPNALCFGRMCGGYPLNFAFTVKMVNILKKHGATKKLILKRTVKIVKKKQEVNEALDVIEL